LTLSGQSYGLHVIKALRNTQDLCFPIILILKAAVSGGKVKSQYLIVRPTRVQCKKRWCSYLTLPRVFMLQRGGGHQLPKLLYLVNIVLFKQPKSSDQSTIIISAQVKLSNYSMDIFVPEDADHIHARKVQLIIVHNCVFASQIRNAYVNKLKKDGIQSLSLFRHNIMVMECMECLQEKVKESDNDEIEKIDRMCIFKG